MDGGKKGGGPCRLRGDKGKRKRGRGAAIEPLARPQKKKKGEVFLLRERQRGGRNRRRPPKKAKAPLLGSIGKKNTCSTSAAEGRTILALRSLCGKAEKKKGNPTGAVSPPGKRTGKLVPYRKKSSSSRRGVQRSCRPERIPRETGEGGGEERRKLFVRPRTPRAARRIEPQKIDPDDPSGGKKKRGREERGFQCQASNS